MGQEGDQGPVLVDSSTGYVVFTSLSLWFFVFIFVFAFSKVGRRHTHTLTLTLTHSHTLTLTLTLHVCEQQWIVTHPGIARRFH